MTNSNTQLISRKGNYKKIESPNFKISSLKVQ